MIFRLIVFLICIIAFINGCNGLISNFAGTHKLRSYSYDEIIENGIGDADFIEVSGAETSDDYVLVSGDYLFRKDLLIIPIVPEGVEGSRVNKPELIGWTKAFDPSCVQRGNCQEEITTPIRGIVNEVKRVKNNLENLNDNINSNQVILIELGRTPFPWYGSLAIMITAFVIIFLAERYQMNKKKKS